MFYIFKHSKSLIFYPLQSDVEAIIWFLWTRLDLDPVFHPTFTLTAMMLINLTMMIILTMITMMIWQTLTKAFIQLSWVMTSQDSPTQAIWNIQQPRGTKHYHHFITPPILFEVCVCQSISKLRKGITAVCERSKAVRGKYCCYEQNWCGDTYDAEAKPKGSYRNNDRVYQANL